MLTHLLAFGGEILALGLVLAYLFGSGILCFSWTYLVLGVSFGLMLAHLASGGSLDLRFAPPMRGAENAGALSHKCSVILVLKKIGPVSQSHSVFACH